MLPNQARKPTPHAGGENLFLFKKTRNSIRGYTDEIDVVQYIHYLCFFDHYRTIMTNEPLQFASLLPRQDQFYKTILDALFDAVYTIDRQGIITYWNDSCSRITGYIAEEMIGQVYQNTPFACGQNGSENHTNHMGILNVIETAMPGSWKGFIHRKNGQRIPVMSRISPILDDREQVVGAVEIFNDVSAQNALETAHQQLLQVSRKDQLTGLYNRSTISELLKAEIERSRRYEQPLAVVMADIDYFKRINDKFGHDAGDKVLAKIGALLGYNLRKPDAVGRWGGEEFLIVTPGSNARAAKTLAERLRILIRKIPLDYVPQTITASFGVAEFSPDMGHDQLLYEADMALYQAKNTGRDRVVVGEKKI